MANGGKWQSANSKQKMALASLFINQSYNQLRGFDCVSGREVDYVWIYLNLYSNYYFFSIYSLFSFTFAKIFGLIERNFPVDHLPLFGLFLPIRFYSN